jgi:hypothetical protein
MRRAHELPAQDVLQPLGLFLKVNVDWKVQLLNFRVLADCLESVASLVVAAAAVIRCVDDRLVYD